MEAKIDVNFVNPFIQGAIQTLQLQCSFTAKPGKPFLKGAGPTIQTDIAAVIGLTSQTFHGTVSICFPKVIFLTVMERMLGEKYAEITTELEDGASELLNIIFGQAKRELNLKGYTIEKAIPTIIRGSNMAVRTLSPSPTVVVPFETEVGVFNIEVTVQQ